MNILICGNTNNFPLLLAEGFIALGHSVLLVLNRKDLLHRPESKYPSWLGKLPEWVLDATLLPQQPGIPDLPLFAAFADKIKSSCFNFVILNDRFVSYGRHFRIPVLSFLTGSDLTKYASHDRHLKWKKYPYKNSRANLRSQKFIHITSEFITNQKFGIFSSNLVSYAFPGLDPQGDLILSSLSVPNERRIMIYMSDVINLRPHPLPLNSTLKIFNGSRINFLRSGSLDIDIGRKGIDVLLKGFSEFIKTGRVAHLTLVEKGLDIKEAKNLVDTLGISAFVTWKSEMGLTEFYKELISSDLVCDQIGHSFPGMVTLDSFALGRPVLANLRSEIFRSKLGLPLPGFDVSCIEEVKSSLISAHDDRKNLVNLSKTSRLYAEQFLSPKATARSIIHKLGLA